MAGSRTRNVSIALIALFAMCLLAAPCAQAIRLSQVSGATDVEKLLNGINQMLASGGRPELDLEGRRINLNAPVVINGQVGSASSFLIRNGRLHANSGSWGSSTMTANCRVNSGGASSSNWGNLACTSAIPAGFRGALVTGPGIGKEVYVNALQNGGRTVKLSSNVYRTTTSNVQIRFTRYRYMLDFGTRSISNMEIRDVSFTAGNVASGLMLPVAGSNNKLTGVRISSVLNRGVTSSGSGCRGLVATDLHIANGSPDLGRRPDQRQNIGININTAGYVLKHMFLEKFLHCVVVTEGGRIESSHAMQGGHNTDGLTFRSFNFLIRSGAPAGGLQIRGNYIDNAGILWSSEANPPTYTGGFRNVEIAGNGWLLITSSGDPMRFIVLQPHHSNMGVADVTVVGNMLRSQNKPHQQPIVRMDDVDTSRGSLNLNNFRNVRFESNDAYAVVAQTCNPCHMYFKQLNSASSQWSQSMGSQRFPFNGVPKSAQGITLHTLKKSNGALYFNLPTSFGGSNNNVQLKWGTAVTGKVSASMRCDVGPLSARDDGEPEDLTDIVRDVTPDGRAVSSGDVDAEDVASWVALAGGAGALLFMVGIAAVVVVVVVTAFVALVAIRGGASAVAHAKVPTAEAKEASQTGAYEAVQAEDFAEDMSEDDMDI